MMWLHAHQLKYVVILVRVKHFTIFQIIYPKIEDADLQCTLWTFKLWLALTKAVADPGGTRGGHAAPRPCKN